MKKTMAYKIVSKNWKSFILDNVNGKQHNRPEKYILSYELNKETRCIKNSIGIMCFKSHMTARMFCNNTFENTCIILEVKGKDRKPLSVLCNNISKLDFFYNIPLESKLRRRLYESDVFPHDTICFESIVPTKIIKIY